MLAQLHEDPKALKGRKLNFMIKNTFLSTTLGDLLAQLGQSNETIVEVYYLFALEKPKPKHSSP